MPEIKSRPKENPWQDAEPFTVSMQKFADTETSDADLHSTEAKNQNRAFELRRLFLDKPDWATFKWVPQAIEAVIRSKRSNFLPNFGVIDSLEVDPKTNLVIIHTHGDIDAQFEIELTDLADYSVELVVEELDKVGEVPEIHYSAQMQKAIQGLSEDAKQRWDLISRLAMHIQSGHRAGDPIEIKAVGSDTFGDIEGMGVFLPNSGRFSALKVIFDDIPLTEQEKKWLQQATIARDFSRHDNDLQNFNHGAYNLSDLADERHNIKRTPSAGNRFRTRLAKLLRPNSELATAAKLRELVDGKVHHSSRFTYLHSDIARAIFKDKKTFQQENPFECTQLPGDEEDKIRQAAEAEIRYYRQLHELLTEKRDYFESLVSGSLDHPRKLTRGGSSSTNSVARKTQRVNQILAEKKAQRANQALKMTSDAKIVEGRLTRLLEDGDKKES